MPDISGPQRLVRLKTHEKQSVLERVKGKQRKDRVSITELDFNTIPDLPSVLT